MACLPPLVRWSAQIGLHLYSLLTAHDAVLVALTLGCDGTGL